MDRIDEKRLVRWIERGCNYMPCGERQAMATELLALRQREERMRKALEEHDKQVREAVRATDVSDAAYGFVEIARAALAGEKE